MIFVIACFLIEKWLSCDFTTWSSCTVWVVRCIPRAVAQSKCPSYVGISGIVVQETLNTLQVVCKDDKLRCKCACVGKGLCACVGRVCVLVWGGGLCTYIHTYM